jgi:CHAT domain-containing protein
VLVVAASTSRDAVPDRGSPATPLRHVPEETEAIQSRALAVTTLLGDSATEAALVDLAREDGLARYTHVHVATHALTDDEDPLRSCLLLTPPTADAAVDAAARGTGTTDGFLTAGEILDGWRLDADLVVLSACETGLGREAGGEGHVGLAQAFLAAGARAVVVSLWKVDDAATAHFMRSFYTHLLPGTDGTRCSPLHALARAREETASWIDPAGRRPYADPTYSSAFVLIGDPGPATPRSDR